MADDDTLTPPAGPSVGSRLVRVVLIVAAVVIAVGVGSAVIPRWWAQRIGGVADGSLMMGSFVGLIVGLVFTLVPLFVLILGWHYRDGLKRAIAFFAVACVLSLPNLATLRIVMGNGNGVHAGERILDVEGPGFRGGSLIGAIVGLLLFVGARYLVTSRRRSRDRVRDLSSQAAENQSD
ncbi:MAG: permease [Actinomycetia bacterium]|nr:permease [Actinomycetes bacterium]